MQRKRKRVILRRNVLINGTIKVMGLDLSEGGIYVYTGRDFPNGCTVDVSLPLSRTINVKARVQHSQTGVGMGLMFLDLKEEDKDAIKSFIRDRGDHCDDNRRKILIVEDNAASRRMYKSKLVLDGYSVLEADDGVQAIEVLSKENIDLMVLDLYMQRLDGFKMLAILRQDQRWVDMPVIVFSARTASSDIEKAMDAGASEFLPKITTSPTKLSERIQSYFKAGGKR